MRACRKAADPEKADRPINGWVNKSRRYEVPFPSYLPPCLCEQEIFVCLLCFPVIGAADGNIHSVGHFIALIFCINSAYESQVDTIAFMIIILFIIVLLFDALVVYLYIYKRKINRVLVTGESGVKMPAPYKVAYDRLENNMGQLSPMDIYTFYAEVQEITPIFCKNADE